MPTLVGQALAQIVAHARRDWPREACGFVFADGTVLEAENIQDRLHLRSPRQYPRWADAAYTVGPADLCRVLDQECHGNPVATAYHSHTRAWGANFSDEDTRGALDARGQPFFPDATYLVVSVTTDGHWLARWWAWRDGRFVNVQTESGP